MLSKPSAPQAQLCGMVSLCLNPVFLFSLFPFPSAFGSVTDPISAFLNNISGVIFTHCLTYCWPWLWVFFLALRDSTESWEQPRQHMVNAASWQTDESQKNSFLKLAERADWIITETLWQVNKDMIKKLKAHALQFQVFDLFIKFSLRVPSHKKQINFHLRTNIWVMN